MRRLLTLVAIVTVLSLVLGACAPAATPAPQPTAAEQPAPTAAPPVAAEKPKLRFWFSAFFSEEVYGAWADRIAAEFAAENNCEVETFHDAEEAYFNKLTVLLETNDLPDVFLLFEAYLPDYIAAGALADLSDVYAETDKLGGGVVEGVKDGVTWDDGKIYGLPNVVWADAWYMRKDLLDAKGIAIPTTYEEVGKASIALSDPTVPICGWGKLFGPYGGDAHFEANSEVWAFGGTVWSEDGQTVTLKSPQTIELVKFIKNVWDNGGFCEDSVNWDSSGNNKCYLGGTCAIMQNAGSVYRSLKVDNPELLAKTVIVPGPAGPTGIHANMTSYDPWVISANSKYPELAKKLLLKMFEVDNQGQYVQLQGGYTMPYYADLREDPMWDDPYLQAFLENGKYSHTTWWPGPKTPWSVKVENVHILQNMYTRVLLEGQDIEASIDQAVKELEELRDSFK
jgi:multiple sugar transport system substrate-binding protein